MSVNSDYQPLVNRTDITPQECAALVARLKEGGQLSRWGISWALRNRSISSLKVLFETICQFDQAGNGGRIDDIKARVTAIKRCAASVSLEDIKEVLKLIMDVEANVRWDEENLENALKRYASQFIKQSSSYNHWKCPSLIENIFIALRYVTDQEPTGPWHASTLLQTYVGLIVFTVVFPTMIDAVLNHHQPEYLDPLALLGILAAIYTVVFIGFKSYKYIHPIPSQIKPLYNYRLAAQAGEIEPVLFRDDIFEKIFRCWQTSNSSGRQQILLVGDSGAGKTSIIQGLAYLFGNEDKVPDTLRELVKEFKHLELFGGPASLFVVDNPMMESDDKLEQVLKIIGNHKHKIIIALDEIHTLLNEKYGTRYAETLKSILDTSVRGLPYVIAATTREEYNKYIKGTALQRRFKKIDVPALKPAEVKLTLQNMMRHYPTVVTSPKFFQKIYETGQTLIQDFPHLRLTQPEISKRLLATALSLLFTKHNQMPANERLKEIQEKMAIETLNDQYALDKQALTFGKQHSIQERIRTLAQQQEGAQQAALTEKEKLFKFHAISQEITTCRKELIVLAAKIETIRKKNMNADHLIREFSLIHYFLKPKLKALYEDLRQQLELPKLKELIEKSKEDILHSIGGITNMPQRTAAALQQVANQFQKLIDAPRPEVDGHQEAANMLEQGMQIVLLPPTIQLMNDSIAALRDASKIPQEEMNALQQIAGAFQQIGHALQQVENSFKQEEMSWKHAIEVLEESIRDDSIDSIQEALEILQAERLNALTLEEKKALKKVSKNFQKIFTAINEAIDSSNVWRQAETALAKEKKTVRQLAHASQGANAYLLTEVKNALKQVKHNLEEKIRIPKQNIKTWQKSIKALQHATSILKEGGEIAQQTKAALQEASSMLQQTTNALQHSANAMQQMAHLLSKTKQAIQKTVEILRQEQMAPEELLQEDDRGGAQLISI